METKIIRCVSLSLLYHFTIHSMAPVLIVLIAISVVIRGENYGREICNNISEWII